MFRDTSEHESSSQATTKELSDLYKDFGSRFIRSNSNLSCRGDVSSAEIVGDLRDRELTVTPWTANLASRSV